ncbi:LPXTG cell wall anchor domain-containing protein [Geodermatophilus sp. Leaf369]|jgi:LPXTG-motif cell wall-anchored protein|nr:LPXTG cell wall anchor domain-containing protein [Geodermatophilus sp. Leaf369]QNG35683.1 LPXTG cell wall anchor domain-containing protein [Geodermatophilaceae bacterium NBWT11]
MFPSTGSGTWDTVLQVVAASLLLVSLVVMIRRR